MRALEMGREMARATNTGISALIDERGLIKTRGPQFEAVVVRGAIRPHQGQTPYSRFGDAPVLLFAVLALIVAVWFARRLPKLPHE